MAINRFKAANVNEGDELIKLSLIFSRTTNPASIKTHNPVEANSNNNG